MKNPLFSKVLNYLSLLRIASWPKNVFVFVPLIFSKYFFESDYLLTAFTGCIIFCIASSAIYIINDIADASKDAIHPVKKNRPIANGSISTRNAKILASFLILVLIGLTVKINLSFMIVIWIYIFINILYSTYLKKIVILDIFCIA